MDPKSISAQGTSKSVLLNCDGLKFDTVSYFDSTLVLRVEMLLPSSKTEKLKNVVVSMKSLLMERRDKFTKGIKPDPNMKNAASGNYFAVRPIECYSGGRLLSILYVIEFGSAGGAHGFAEYYTFNFDLEKQKQIDFNEYFEFKENQDKEKLIKMINDFFNDENIKVEKFYDFDFNIEGNTITFNFDDYEVAAYAYGMQRAIFDKSVLAKYIRRPYQ